METFVFFGKPSNICKELSSDESLTNIISYLSIG